LVQNTFYGVIMKTLKEALKNSANVDGIVNSGAVPLTMEDTVFDDSKFPFTGNRIDVSAGRLDYNYFNGGIDFQSNAQYPGDPVSMKDQMLHCWKAGTDLHPHIHWIQNSSAMPNWLLAYKVIDTGVARVKETGYTNHTLVKGSSNAFTYTSGNLDQITLFPAIDMSGYDNTNGLSLKIHYVFFRDSADTSGLFGSSDSGLGTQFVDEFDVHFQKDTLGSQDEYSK